MRNLADKNNIHIGAAVYTYHLDNPVHGETLAREFNMLTPENEAKLCEIQPQKGKFDFSKFDKLVDFAEKNKMVVRGHTLVWHQCVPDWLANGKFTRDEAIELLHNHISTVMGHYKGRILDWDVVNEAIADNAQLRDTPWRRFIGDDYIEMAFRFAHEADPDALLFYNDYNADGVNAKSTAIYNMVKDFLKRSVPINGVGFQAHIALGDTQPGGSANPKTLGENMKRFGDLGLQVQITELDIKFMGKPTDKILLQQAADYRNMMETCLNNKNCTAFVVWGVTDKFSWLRSPQFYQNPDVAPLLFDDSYKPKKAYYAIEDILARHAGLPPILSDADLAAMFPEQSTDAPLPDPTKTDAAQLAPDSVPGVAYYAAYPLTIKLDGDDSDWKNVPRVVVDKGPTIPPNNDTTLTFAVAADTANLYFLADVKDSKVVYGKHDPATEWYKEDSVEFYINATGDFTLTSYAPGVAQIGILAANITHPDKPILGGNNNADSQIKVYATKTPDGYRIEAAVPLVTKVWLITLKHLGEIGFQAHLNGASGDDRDLKLIWSLKDTQDQSYTNPSLFGKLIFWNKAVQP